MFVQKSQPARKRQFSERNTPLRALSGLMLNTCVSIILANNNVADSRQMVAE